MAISSDGWNHGTGSKTTDLGGASPVGSTPTGGYIKVSPVNIESFTISTNLGTLTKSDFILTGTYYEYYNLNLTSVQSASATGYATSITKTSSHDEPIYNIVFHPTRLYAWTDPNASTETLYAWITDTTRELTPAAYTFYTKTLSNIDGNTPIYDSTGTELCLLDEIWSSSFPVEQIYEITDTTITLRYSNSG